jgi:hypothetical protein
MRALLAALVALAALPATASGQVVLQDLSLTGQVVAAHSATEKTVRFLVRPKALHEIGLMRATKI